MSATLLLASVNSVNSNHIGNYDKLYSPQMVVTIYYKIHNEINDLTKEKRQRTKLNW